MNELEREWLAELSVAVRESSLKRFRAVRDGLENRRYAEGKMSFADLAFHLVECDRWMVRTVHGERLAPVRESRCACHDRMEYEKLLDSLDESGKTRATLIRTLSSPEFARTVYDPRAGHDVTVWWLIVRGNLDHEIHHRGQLSLLLNLVK